MSYTMPSDAEARRTLATMMHGLASRGLHRIAVTSAGRGEGRSSITAEAGRALAASGRESVLLVDGDALQPSLHRHAGLQAGRGLGELLDEVYHADLTSEDPRQFGVGDWLEILRGQTRTGELSIREEDRSFQLRLVKGAVCSIESPADGDLRLGEILTQRGRITARQLEDGLRIQTESCRPLGDVLGSLGWVGREELMDALRAQNGQRLVRLLELQQPECRFHEMAESYRPAAGGRSAVVPEGDDVDELVFGRLQGYLRHPFLASQVPSYISDTDLQNLKVLTAGERPCDPFSPRYLPAFSLLMSRLARSYDVVLVDVPPMSVPGVAGALGRLSDGALLVVRARGADVGELRRTVETFRRSQSHLLGVVLNQVDELDLESGGGRESQLN